MVQGSGIGIGQKFVAVVAVLMSVVVLVVVVVVIVVEEVLLISFAMVPQYPPNKFQKPKFQVIPPNSNGWM